MAITSAPARFAPSNTSSLKVRCIRTAHAMSRDVANNCPSRSLPQCSMVIVVGSTRTTGSACAAEQLEQADGVGRSMAGTISQGTFITSSQLPV